MSRDRKDTAAAEHHYFPKALQKFWRDDSGWVHRVTNDGKRDSSKNGTFGHIRNAHRIKLSDKPSPWDESFEYTFRSADDSIPRIVALLSAIEARPHVEHRHWRERLHPQWQLQEHREAIAELIASLVVRSPNLREGISVGVQGFFNGTGPWPDGKVPSSLIAANQRPMLECYSRALAQRGKFAILLSDQREFIFGDGMLHNFHPGVITPNNPKCVVSILPTVAIAYNCPTSYSKSADFVATMLTPGEVDEINCLTQIYSGRHIYFRNSLPADLSYFMMGEYQMLQYHQSEWLDSLMRVVANTWF